MGCRVGRGDERRNGLGGDESCVTCSADCGLEDCAGSVEWSRCRRQLGGDRRRIGGSDRGRQPDQRSRSNPDGSGDSGDVERTEDAGQEVAEMVCVKQREFRFSSGMRSSGLILLGLTGFAYLFLFSVPVFHFFSLLTAEKGDFVFIAVFSLGLVPFTLIGLYLFYRHSGCVILTKDAVVLKRFGREKRMLYSDIVEIE